MGAKELDIEDLEARVADRKEFLLKLIGFTGFIIENGKLVDRRTSSSNTSVKWELNDFDGFSFRYSSSWGSSLAILRRGETLLSFEWWPGEEPKVRAWSSQEGWRSEVEHTLESKDEVAEREKLKKELKREEITVAAEEKIREEKLLAEAKRLGL